jgi:hypothetical protein
MFAAGIVPYFTRRTAVDILGKSDRHVARLRPFPGAKVGHGKIDPAYTLSAKPDLIVTDRSLTFVNSLTPGTRSVDYVTSFLASPGFLREYRPYPVADAFLLLRTAIFTRRGSPEYARRHWRSVTTHP